MRMLRIENGTLTEIADELLRLVPKEEIPKGSVIMYGSISHMGVVSAERYAMDWMRNRNWMLGRLGEVIIHTSHKYRCGGQVGALEHARHLGMVRLTSGSGAAFGEKRQKMLGGHLSGKDKEGAGLQVNLVMPVSLSKEAGTILCTSGEWGERPTALVRLKEAG
jgi:hypothetical protein